MAAHSRPAETPPSGTAARDHAAEAGDNNKLGPRLRQRRKVRGMSLHTVASKAGISIGLLSQIERGLTMPSVNSLNAICSALEMPVGWIFDAGGGPQERYVVRAHQRRVLDLGAKGMRKELMTPDEISGIQMMRLVIQPEAQRATHRTTTRLERSAGRCCAASWAWRLMATQSCWRLATASPSLLYR